MRDHEHPDYPQGYTPLTHHTGLAIPSSRVEQATVTPRRIVPRQPAASWGIDAAFDAPASAGQVNIADPSGALRADGGKPEMALIPAEAIEEIAKALTFGAKKYSPDNWRKGFSWLRVTSCLLRHIFAWMRGEDKDPETGLSHLAHAGSNLCFLLTYERTKTGTDDRYKAT